MTRSVRFPRSFAFRMTTEDADRLRTVAAARGIAPAEMARMIVSRDVGLHYERRAVQRRIHHGEQLRALLTELWRQGNNLNQIARALNTPGPSALEEAALATLPAIDAALRRIERAILDAIGTGDRTRL